MTQFFQFFEDQAFGVSWFFGFRILHLNFMSIEGQSIRFFFSCEQQRLEMSSSLRNLKRRRKKTMRMMRSRTLLLLPWTMPCRWSQVTPIFWWFRLIRPPVGGPWAICCLGWFLFEGLRHHCWAYLPSKRVCSRGLWCGSWGPCPGWVEVWSFPWTWRSCWAGSDMLLSFRIHRCNDHIWGSVGIERRLIFRYVLVFSSNYYYPLISGLANMRLKLPIPSCTLSEEIDSVGVSAQGWSNIWLYMFYSWG